MGIWGPKLYQGDAARDVNGTAGFCAVQRQQFSRMGKRSSIGPSGRNQFFSRQFEEDKWT